MSLPLFQVDAFTAQPFKGNPAGVCLLDGPRPDTWMQAVAQEMNLSETAFLLPEGDGYRLRWFTPAAEVVLCGHATLASARVLYDTGRLAPGATARFYTLSGLLTAEQRDGWIELDFPASPPAEVQPPAGLLMALGVRPLFTGCGYNQTYLVEVDGAGQVRAVRPDFAALKAVESVRAVIVTSLAGPQEAGEIPYDIISRYFTPRMGIDEDPVTGAAHTLLAPYWAAKLGRTHLSAYQASRRGGFLRLRLEGDRVRIAGQAVMVFKTELEASF
jgi:PhzF family phenazine biosynthesis protein